MHVSISHWCVKEVAPFHPLKSLYSTWLSNKLREKYLALKAFFQGEDFLLHFICFRCLKFSNFVSRC